MLSKDTYIHAFEGLDLSEKKKLIIEVLSPFVLQGDIFQEIYKYISEWDPTEQDLMDVYLAAIETRFTLNDTIQNAETKHFKEVFTRMLERKKEETASRINEINTAEILIDSLL